MVDLNGDWDYNDAAESNKQVRYFFDRGRMVYEVSADGSVENNYLFNASGELVAVEDLANSLVKYALVDHLGTVRDVIVVDAGVAAHTEHNIYGAFGRVTERQEFDGTN